jgi:preprotein translocase subunit SecD
LSEIEQQMRKLVLLVLFLAPLDRLAAAGDQSLFELRVVTKTVTETSDLKSLPPRDGQSEAVLVEGEVLLDQKAIKSASVDKDSDGAPQIRIQFTEDGAKKFGEITQKFIGQRLAIFVDGGLQSAPVIRDRISGGTAIISGNFSESDAAKLVAKINSSVTK